jgi:2-polyprenyl-3-methyl-5-hydroxy-6-metoxy-1,4-benzoquinol methylase
VTSPDGPARSLELVRWRSESRPCPLCGEPCASAVALGRRGGGAHRLGLGVETQVVRCRRCHGVYQRPTLLPDGNPYALESSEYFAAHSSAARIASGALLARRALRFIGSKGRLLELGCGCGEILRGAADEGWTVAGVDMTPAFVELARARFGLKVELASIEQASFLDREWDVVVLGAALEHVYDPGLVLRRVFASLRPGGILFVDVPNECSLYTRLGNLYLHARGQDWAVNLSPTFPPFHVVGFCPKSLRLAVTACGFELLALEPYEMLPCFRNQPGPWGRGLETTAVKWVLRLGPLLGMADGMICWAKRPHGSAQTGRR